MIYWWFDVDWFNKLSKFLLSGLSESVMDNVTKNYHNYYLQYYNYVITVLQYCRNESWAEIKIIVIVSQDIHIK